MSLHHLAIMTKPSLSCLLCFLCMLAIPIFPFLKFEDLLVIGRAKRAHLVVQLARIFYIFASSHRVARYRIASKCFYAFLFRRPRGEKYRNTLLPLAHTMLKHAGVTTVKWHAIYTARGRTVRARLIPGRPPCARIFWRARVTSWRHCVLPTRPRGGTTA